MKFMLFSSNITQLNKVLCTPTCIHHRPNVSTIKHGNLFMVGAKFFGQMYEGLLCMRRGGLKIGSYQRARKSFINAFSSNVSNVNLKISPNQRSSHVQFSSSWLLIYYLKSWHRKYGAEFEKQPLHNEIGDFMQSLPSRLISLLVTCTLMPQL